MSLKPARTMEIGLAAGGSCLVLTQAQKDLGAPPKQQHIAIDPYQLRPWMDEAGLEAVR